MKRLLSRLWSGRKPERDPAVVEAAERAQRFRTWAHDADLARDARDWPTAAAAYETALSIDGDQVALRVQYGHALKETGRLAEAEAAYRRAVQDAPEDADACLQLAHVLKMQRKTTEAQDAYVEALRRDPGLTLARDELIAAGGRDRLDNDVYGRSAVAARLARLSGGADEVLAQIRDSVTAAAFPVAGYDAFRRQYPIQPPPAATAPVFVIIEGIGATPSALRATITSLMDQRKSDWRAIVVTDPAIQDHPVASLATIDPRLVFRGPDRKAIEAILREAPLAPVLAVSAGALLDPEALGWFAYGLMRTGAVALYGDHDHFEINWRTGPVWFSPVFQSMADRHDVAGSPHPPAAIVIAPVLRKPLLDELLTPMDAVERRRRWTLQAIETGPTAHLPRTLVSVPVHPAATVPVHPSAPSEPSSRILVVIPTRDEPDMLDRCILTLRDRAARPDLIDILVVDNRSTEEKTRDLLSSLAADGRIEVAVMDEPFNWAHLNNAAVKDRSQALLVFANNDTEMVTQDWDDRLRTWLAQPDVGVVGARLLYPDGALQHGGILLGAWEGRPSHDGLWAERSEGGPLDRWRRSRAAAAVTGAFMACRRGTFEQAGGFDGRLAIAYNDIDFCLKVRAAGLDVLYAADIELIHYESRTRGHNDAPEKVAWDDGELADMHRRWGEALFCDPGRNPHWAAAVNRPYDGYQAPPLSRILKHLDHSARPRPWRIESDQADPV